MSGFGRMMATLMRQQVGRIVLVDNVDCTEVLPHGSEEEVIEAVKETIAKASVGGGHPILASSNSIHPGVKPENYKVMIETGKRFGKYPPDPKMVEKYQGDNYISKIGK